MAAKRYGPEHVHLRARLIKRYRPGVTRCWRCGLPICETDTSKIDLGHVDGTDRRALEHRRCNRAAARRLRAARAKAAREQAAGTVTELRPAPAAVVSGRPW